MYKQITTIIGTKSVERVSTTSRLVNPRYHHAWLFDNYAYISESIKDTSTKHTGVSIQTPNQHPKINVWKTEHVVAFFWNSRYSVCNKKVLDICSLFGFELEQYKTRLQSRLQHLINPVLSSRSVAICIGDATRTVIGPSSSSGFASRTSDILLGKTDDVLQISFPGAEKLPSFIACRTVLAEQYGWGIISDIDDTIKITITSSPIGVFTSTFIDDPQPVKGMPELYSSLVQLLSNPTTFYVSASPYTLYPFLRGFRDDHFPFGQIMLRETSFYDPTVFITNLLDGVEQYKLERIAKIHSWFPHRKYILIGDSTHKDPEIYGEVARLYPNWVQMIFIRRVKGVSEVACPDLDWKLSDKRFEEAFKGVDKKIWSVFDGPQEVEAIVKARLQN